ncbi:hypothetical protein [Dokdonia sp.]|uniref:hypothetical protein n=1 Tax=Dokdonia sp. TaxID=2024995 RepID=UPI003264A9C0
MKDIRILDNGVLEITPSETSSKNDFDFYVGSWKIKNRKLKDRLCNCTEWIEFDALQKMQSILLGLGNTDDFVASFDGEPFEGRTIRLFNPTTRLWSMYWTDSTTGVLQPPTVGSFYGDVGRFYTKDIFNKQDIIVMFEWDKTDIENPIWSQAFSTDNGTTWEYNWYMYMSKNDDC